MNPKTYSKKELQQMNFNSKYGSQWIKNIYNLNETDLYCIYATEDCDLVSGRMYVALPSNKMITIEDKKKYNLI